jgi:hypothetical protein
MSAVLLTLVLSFALIGVAVYAGWLLLRSLRSLRRTRRALLAWTPAGQWKRAVPPVVLTLVSAIALSYALVESSGFRMIAFSLGFALVGVLWTAAVRLASLVIVTPDGILVDLNTPRSLLRWTAIEDYFDGSPTPWHYGFFYYDARGQRRRLNLEVPRRLRTSFEQLVRVALCDRIERSLPQAVRRSAPHR